MKDYWNWFCTYIVNLLIGIDQLINTLIGGEPDETISSRSWRLSGQYRFWTFIRVFVDALARVVFNQRDHCFESYTSERLRSQFPPELR